MASHSPYLSPLWWMSICQHARLNVCVKALQPCQTQELMCSTFVPAALCTGGRMEVTHTFELFLHPHGMTSTSQTARFRNETRCTRIQPAVGLAHLLLLLPSLVRHYQAGTDSAALDASPTPQIPVGDNYFTALNSAVFSDGSFVYVPKGVHCPMELSTYFRINASETGQVSTRARGQGHRLLMACDLNHGSVSMPGSRAQPHTMHSLTCT